MDEMIANQTYIPAEIWQLISDRGSPSASLMLSMVAPCTKSEYGYPQAAVDAVRNGYAKLVSITWIEKVCDLDYEAVKHGQVNILANILEHVTPSSRSLEIATKVGDLQIINMLSRAGCTLTPRAIINAGVCRHKHVVEWLVESKYEVSPQYLYEGAVAGGSVEIMAFLNERIGVENMGEIGSCSLQQIAMSNGDVAMLDYLVVNMGIVVLTVLGFDIAADCGHISMLQYLLQRNPDIISYSGSRAVGIAVRGNHFAAAQWLLDNGAVFNTQSMMQALWCTNVRALDWVTARGFMIPRNYNILCENMESLPAFKWLYHNVFRGEQLPDYVVNRLTPEALAVVTSGST